MEERVIENKHRPTLRSGDTAEILAGPGAGIVGRVIYLNLMRGKVILEDQLEIQHVVNVSDVQKVC